MGTQVWQLQEAKSKFSNLVEKAQYEGPQVVTKHGQDAVVVIAFDEYRKMIAQKSDLVSFLGNSPLMDVELDITRDKSLHREIEL